MGDCPYEDCKGYVWEDEGDKPLPLFTKHECETCHRIIWTYLSRIIPYSMTEADFLAKYEVDEATKSIKEKVTA